MLSRWLISSSSATAVPAEATGQTLVLREEMPQATLNASNLGTFTSVSTGEAWGQLPNGPTWLGTAGDQSTRRNWSTALAGNGLSGNPVVPAFAGRRDFTGVTRGIISVWVRPGDFRNGVSERRFLTAHTSAGDLQWAVYSNNFVANFSVGYGFGTQLVDVAITQDEWYQVQWYWSSADKSVTKIWDVSGNLVYHRESTLAFGVTVTGFTVTSSAPTGQWQFTGRMGPVSVYSVTNETDGVKQTSGMLPPTNEQIRWTILPDGTGATDYQTRTISGWSALAQARSRGVISERYNGWKRTDTLANAGYDTLTDSASKRAWWVAWDAGLIAPQGDVCEFAAGVYRVTASSPLTAGRGVTYKNGPGVSAFAPDIRCTEQLLGTWSRPDSVNYPKVWQYDGATLVNRHVWGASWQSFTPYSHTTDTLATNLAALNGREWACYTRPSTGVTYISLPTGTTPASIGPLEGSTGAGIGWNGSYVNGLLLNASATYNFGVGTGGDKALGAYLVGVDHVRNGITVVNNVRALRYAKHAHAVVTAQPEMFCIFKALDVGFAPPSNSGNFGVGTGDFTALVDYNGIDPGATPSKFVSIYDGVTESLPTEPGDGSSTAVASRRQMYYAHGIGAFTGIIAKTVVKDPVAAMLTPSNFNGSPVPSSHVEFEVINPRP